MHPTFGMGRPQARAAEWISRDKLTQAQLDLVTYNNYYYLCLSGDEDIRIIRRTQAGNENLDGVAYNESSKRLRLYEQGPVLVLKRIKERETSRAPEKTTQLEVALEHANGEQVVLGQIGQEGHFAVLTEDQPLIISKPLLNFHPTLNLEVHYAPKG